MTYTYIPEHEAEEQFNDYIDEATGVVTILGMAYCASRILKEIDPVAYNCELANYLDSMELTTDEPCDNCNKTDCECVDCDNCGAKCDDTNQQDDGHSFVCNICYLSHPEPDEEE
jgi:hypothetical protein